jgi:lipopolysaccharide export system protein LptA
MHPVKSNFIPLALLLLIAPLCHAERADSEKPVHLEADKVLVDDAHQVSTFSGNVKLSQGTLLILGDKIILVQDKEGYKHVTVNGKTASFRQKREGFDEYVEGYGERIEYDTRTETVDFYVQASLKREQDEVRGAHITYNAKTEIFQVNGNTTAQRVHAILQSKKGAAARQDKLPIKAADTLQPAE